MALLSEKFAGALSTVAHPPGASRGDSRIHASAVIHASAKIAAGVQVGAHCVIEAEARIGAGSVLYPGCYVGPSCSLGEDCVLFPGVTLYEWTELGKRVRIHAGAVLGSDGFGYAPVKAPGAEGGKPGVVGHQKIYHLGRVVVGDDVEIGANSCVDRSTFGETRIDRNSKLDNLVHLGHNARLEEGAIVCGGTCLAGNASVGKYAYVGGLTGVANQVHVGDGASVGALTLVTKDVPPGSTAVGNPQREYREHFKAHATLSRLVKSRGEKNE
jgi:UDP-3-O-[3-hydroxymyristoyl] glucosamine N-acyltransferase